MPTKPARSRVVQKRNRFYLDARDLGIPNRIALKPAGSTHATTDRAVAEKLAAAKIAELQGVRDRNERLGLHPGADLREFCDTVIQRKENGGRYVRESLDSVALYLDRADRFFYSAGVDESGAALPGVQAAEAKSAVEAKRCGFPRNLGTISPPDVRAWVKWLGTLPNGRRGTRGTLGPQTIRQHLKALDGVFKAAISDGLIELGHNPVAALVDKPTAPATTTRPLEAADLALLLEAARTLPDEVSDADRLRPLPCAYELLAFFLLTGAREDEVRHMNVEHLLFQVGAIEIHGTKTAGSDRIVPMHPQLRDILRPYVARTGRLSGPLFTGATGERVGSWTRTLDRIAVRAGFQKGEIRTRRFRVSYATHRCTCDGVDANKVRLELGHGSLSMMEKVYTRAQLRGEPMGPEMAFRVERHRGELGERLERLGTWAGERRAEDRQGRAGVVAAFLAAVEGLGVKRAMQVTGVDRSVIQRLRAGAASAEQVKGKTLEAMRAHLDRAAAAA